MSVKIEVLCFKNGICQDALSLVHHYLKLISFKDCELQIHWLKSVSESDPEKKILNDERVVLDQLRRLSGQVWLADAEGQGWRDEDWLKAVRSWFQSGPRRLIFVVGGPYGFSSNFKSRFPNKLALAYHTTNHQLALILLMEALWRFIGAYRGHPYHHG